MKSDVSRRVSGTEIAYAISCKRKLWLFSKGIKLEDESDDVLVGKVIDEVSFGRDKKGIEVGGSKFDFFRFKGEVFIHEVKKSSSLEESHIWQVKYYIYLLRKNGVKARFGVIHYPKAKRKVEVELTDEDEEQIEEIIREISEIRKMKSPPRVERKPYCKRCAYYEFCFV